MYLHWGIRPPQGLGVSVSRQTVILLGAAIAMSSLCCAVGGGLSFVGLVCPHLARRLVGPNFKILIGTTVLTGALLMTVSDIISRTLLSPNEISIGIVAAVIGAPVLFILIDPVLRKEEPMEPILKGEGISVGYQQNTIIQEMDVQIPKGQITSIIGPNGCGKSTLLKPCPG